MSNIFPSTLNNISFLTTIYTVLAVVIIYPYFENKKKFFLTVAFFGFLFDITYTGTFLLHLFLFIIIGLTINFLNNILSYNIFTTNLISIISIIIYHLLSFIILNLFRFGNYPFILLFNIIYHSLFMTIIYTSLSYFIINKLFTKFNLKHIK